MLHHLQGKNLSLIPRGSCFPFSSPETLQDLVSAMEDRGFKIGKAIFQELTGLRKPTLDKNNIVHCPVLLLYAEVMSSDFIEDFCETDMFSAHLDMISFKKIALYAIPYLPFPFLLDLMS